MEVLKGLFVGVVLIHATCIYAEGHETCGNKTARGETAGYSSYPKPPLKGTFAAECSFPDSRHIWDICWANGTTLLVYHGKWHQILKVDVDFDNGTCNYSVLDVSGSRMSCAANGDIYLVYKSTGTRKIHVIRNGNLTIESLNDTVNSGKELKVATGNAEHLALVFKKAPGLLYTRDFEFLHRISSQADEYDLAYARLSRSSRFLATTAYSGSLFIHDLKNHFTVRVGQVGKGPGQFDLPGSISFDRTEQYVFICENESKRISVFGTNGQFYDALHLGNGAHPAYHHDVYHPEGKASVLAFRHKIYKGDSIQHTIKVYILNE